MRLVGVLFLVAGCGRINFDLLDGDGDLEDAAIDDDAGSLTLPSSCVALPSDCGPTASLSCCESPTVPGGTFFRGNDAAGDSNYKETTFPATLSSYRLDTYEVTVGRFRAFVEAGQGTQASAPAAGAGAHALIAGSGWDTSWNANLELDTAALRAGLECDGAVALWTDTPAGNEKLPLNCMTWYEAMAFCIWDGGYLPTEAEWHYAASGGSEQRAYPWSVPASDTTIDCTLANTSGCGVGGGHEVGTLSPRGDGRWGHADLSGNMWEWMLDTFGTYPTPCIDCANVTPDTERSITSGAFDNGPGSARVGNRLTWTAADRDGHVGFRCARPAL